VRAARLLGLAAAAALVLAAARVLAPPAPDLAFAERPDLPGFRALGTAAAPGGTSAAALGPLALLGPDAAPAAVPADACAALYADPSDPVIGDGPVAAALFTDYRCPYCRVLSGLLRARAEAGALRLVVKEWPILGPDSARAARAALAADAQGAFAAVHDRLIRTSFVVNEGYLEDVARTLDLDAGRLAADADGPAVGAALARTAALAGHFGFRGTPGLVVGRTIVEGALDAGTLDALIAAETRDGGCGA
jgi:protein-disulfide isomerase